MGDVAISVQNLGKLYRIGQFIGSKTLRESLTNAMLAPFRVVSSALNRRESNGKEVRPNDETIWALKNISFEVKQGEAVGIIGRNGAGKTTLLRILTGVTTPSEGYAEIHGRVSSLLEVGTGFHAELSGRENIYVSAAILGMTRKEIQRKFVEIVEFSGVGKFLDTPLKRYSSGMQVRLAFAVAAHLEPEIMLVDEVLAVGDAEFQKKCLGKMDKVTKGGRTVLFVSHNMAAIKALCPRTILLDQGKILEDGPTQKVVQHYLGSGLGTCAERKWDDIESAPGNDVVRLRAVRAKNGKGKVTSEFNIQEPIYVEVEFLVLEEGYVLEEVLRFYDESGSYLFASINYSEPDWRNRKRPVGLYRSMCYVPGNLLNDGTITVGVTVINKRSVHAIENDAISFYVFDPGSGGARGDYIPEWPDTVIRPLLQWKTEYISEGTNLIA